MIDKTQQKLQAELTALNTEQIDLKNKISEWEAQRQKLLTRIRQIENQINNKNQIKLL